MTHTASGSDEQASASGRASRAGLDIDASFCAFVEDELLAPLGLARDRFWLDVAALFERFTPRNEALLERRAELQARIDDWHRANPGPVGDMASYRDMLNEIGWLVPEPAPFEVTTDGCDPEISALAGPQLVVPVLNARFALNAANARWGSLYDALYGTDALDAPPAVGTGYDPERGRAVIEAGRAWLDRIVPLAGGSWHDWTGDHPVLANGAECLAHDASGLLLRHHGLHVALMIDPAHPIGATDPAGIADIQLEAALSTIIDLEDSVAVVDAADKLSAYRNWLGLMRGDLADRFEKGGRMVERRLADDRRWTTPESDINLPGRSLLLVRNVGHLTRNDVILISEKPVFEGICDAIFTSLIALLDVRGLGSRRNSRTGAIYIVKPKMHGPDEAAFANDLFDAVEDLLRLGRHQIKVGVMDEERRTSANLAAVIYAVRHRIAFINTGFLDRTGDEIHTSMAAGPMLPRAAMKRTDWITAYEARNVAIGLACGLGGRAQIGKGMWAMPDRMADMLEQKVAHPRAGASTAWVPSPTAATLHALHYHLVSVSEARDALAATPSLDALLTVPLATSDELADDVVAWEVDSCCQSILGYVVRWIDHGVGCSKVPDIDGVGLMEDRATLRISSQLLANWLRHGVTTADHVDQALAQMARVVDEQNAGDEAYRPMSGNLAPSLAFQAARALIFEGADQPSGYTEPLLMRFRKAAKQAAP